MPVTSVPNDKELEIHQDWFVSDLETVEDCDKAILYLTTAIASVEQQLELFARDPNSNREWVGRARYARRMQLTALEACRMRRQRFAKEQRDAEEANKITLFQLQMEATARKRADLAAYKNNKWRRLLDHIHSVVPPEQFAKWVEDSGVQDMQAPETDGAA